MEAPSLSVKQSERTANRSNIVQGKGITTCTSRTVCNTSVYLLQLRQSHQVVTQTCVCWKLKVWILVNVIYRYSACTRGNTKLSSHVHASARVHLTKRLCGERSRQQLQSRFLETGLFVCQLFTKSFGCLCV